VEKAIVTYLRENVLTSLSLSDIVKHANLFLQEESNKPKEDPSPMKRRLKLLKRERDRLAEAVATGDGNLKSILMELKKREKAIHQVRQSLRRLKTERMPLPKPLVDSDVQAMLDDLQGLLNEDVAIAAPILRKVLGPIEISPGERKEHRRAAWIAKFTVNLVPALLQISAQRKLPTTPCLEFLTIAHWKFAHQATFEIKRESKYKQIAPIVVEMGKRMTQKEIALKLGTSEIVVYYAMDYGKHGILPNTKPKRIFRFHVLGEEVFRLVHNESLTLRKAAKRLGESPNTTKKAYDYQCSVIEKLTGMRPERPFKGKGCRLPPETVSEIHKMVKEGRRPCEIYRSLGCSRSSVSLEMKRINQTVLNTNNALGGNS